MDRRGRWRAWRFAPGIGPAPGIAAGPGIVPGPTPALGSLGGPAHEAGPTSGHDDPIAAARATGHVLFASVQAFAGPRQASGTPWWRQVRDQYVGDGALPHLAPLYFDIDCDGDLDQALAWARELVTFFMDELELPRAAVRVWFSGSKGTHVLIDAAALGIEPSPTLTADMKLVVHDLVKHLASRGVPEMKIDSSVYSLPRMLRLPDQVNPTSGLYKVELTHDQLMRCSTEQITEWAARPRGSLWSADDLPQSPAPKAAAWWSSTLARVRQPREFRIKTAQVAGLRVRPDGYVVDELASATMPSCIKAIFDASPPLGTRNRCELQIACWAKGAKLPYARAQALLSAWTDRNRPELSAQNASRKADSIIRSVYGHASYGFSCAAARSACRAVGLEPNCQDCQVVQRRAPRHVHSLRVSHDEQWSPGHRISLEESRGLIAAAIDDAVAIYGDRGNSGGGGALGHRAAGCG
jgi:hypothetical protein